MLIVSDNGRRVEALTSAAITQDNAGYSDEPNIRETIRINRRTVIFAYPYNDGTRFQKEAAFLSEFWARFMKAVQSRQGVFDIDKTIHYTRVDMGLEDNKYEF